MAELAQLLYFNTLLNSHVVEKLMQFVGGSDVESNANKVILFADLPKFPHQIIVSPDYSPPFGRHGLTSAAALC